MIGIRMPDWYGVVRGNQKKTKGYLLASSQPCIEIRDREIRAVSGRMLVARDPRHLARWNPKGSWLLAVVLCPGDRLDDVIEWVRRRKLDGRRILVYLLAGMSDEVLRSAYRTGFYTDQAEYVADWQELHKLFGLALNDRIFEDWQRD